MFTKFAEFRIKNQKLTVVIICVVLLTWIFSRLVIPKQYNPKIDAPAFNIVVPAPWYSAKQVEELIVKPLENKVWEVNWIDDIYWYANNNFGAVMVTFKVGQKKEDATVRLYNKIFSNLDLKTYWVQDPIIKNIDPDELPIYTFAVYSTKTWINKIQLRKTALELIDWLKDVNNVRWFYLIWWDKETISIFVDIQKAEFQNVPIAKIIDVIKKNNIWLPWWKIRFWDLAWSVDFDWKLDDINSIKKLVVWNYNWKIVRLEDVAQIKLSVPEELNSTRLWTNNLKNIKKNVVFVWIAKKDWTNAVYVVNDIKKRLKLLKQELPSFYKIEEIQNLWKKAKDATDMLLVNLIQSIIIVLIVLTAILWFRNAINVAISIPLTLSVVFLFSLIIGDNINRITLFALILVLWMLVDDATVVVENINRKLHELHSKSNDILCEKWEKNRICVKKRQLKAIFEAIKEVELWVILSTVTRVLAFGAMFFVTWMMWSYMRPIPKYAMVAMITSTAVALSINPFLTDLFYNLFERNNKEKNTTDKNSSNISQKIKNILKKMSDPIFLFIKNIVKKIKSKINQNEIIKKIKKFNFKKFYYWYMNYFLDEKNPQRLKLFKLWFWITLFVIIVIPPALLIFKMRMLPKSNQNQIFLRVDIPQNKNYNYTKKSSNQIENFLIKKFWYQTWSKNKLKIIKSISTWNWIAPMPNFANVFRRSMTRNEERYISMRINLIDKTKRKISSEEFTIKIRSLVRKFIKEIEPKATIRLLEEPPGPPTQATYMLKIQWETNDSYKNIENLANRIYKKLQPMFIQQDVVDHWTSISTYQTKYLIKFDHQRASRLWINAELVAYTIRSVFNWIPMTIYHDPNSKEWVDLFITVKNIQKNTKKIFDKITVPTNKWWFIPLKQIATIINTENDHPIYSDNKIPTVYIYWEMWDNSVVYPIIMTYRLMLDKNFWENKFEVTKIDFYWINIKDKLTWKNYRIWFGWERELTMDTFRDLWIAMIIAFLAIYFVMVWQFKSFGTWWVVMLSFLFWFFWVFPLFTILYLLNNEYFSATSMIWVIALAWIVVWNAILLLEYITILVKEQWYELKEAIIKSWFVRMKPILITSMTTIFWATTILWDPVWSWLAFAIIWWLISSAIMSPMILPLFLYKSLKNNKELFETE